MFTVDEIKANRDKWVAALRSGNYEQTHYALKDAAGMCCLGVLCDVLEPDGWTSSSTGAFYHTGGIGDARDGLGHAMPSVTTLERVGLVSGNASILSEMNDEGGASFADIADRIETLPIVGAA